MHCIQGLGSQKAARRSWARVPQSLLPLSGRGTDPPAQPEKQPIERQPGMRPGLEGYSDGTCCQQSCRCCSSAEVAGTIPRPGGSQPSLHICAEQRRPREAQNTADTTLQASLCRLEWPQHLPRHQRGLWSTLLREERL